MEMFDRCLNAKWHMASISIQFTYLSLQTDVPIVWQEFLSTQEVPITCPERQIQFVSLRNCNSTVGNKANLMFVSLAKAML